jgi:dTDP-4-amino-4,6-dideoxygalactose transaminase
MINVTKTFLPPVAKYEAYIQGIFQRAWLTNSGPLVNELESKLKDYLNVENLLFLTNGTIAIQIAIRALGLKGEVITTPFSYVATSSALVWEYCRPVFVDIDPETFNINPALIEGAITEKTTGILATHVFGNPCDIDSIHKVAEKHGLKVIYDAAHCFGTEFRGRSVFSFGDVSTSSFHATKLFHTAEGGAVITGSAELSRKMSLLRNFGHTSPTTFDGVGVNAKNSEFHAAMGLAVLDCMPDILRVRKKQWDWYKKGIEGLGLRTLKVTEGTTYFNGAYFPVVFPSADSLSRSIEALNNHYIYPRRYFYPSLNTLDYVRQPGCANSENIAETVLCLPLYHDLSMEEQELIVGIISKVTVKNECL